MTINWPAIGAIVVPHVGGFSGSILARENVIKWYTGLKKPGFTPPNWAFAPVWTGIYTGIGYASYLVWRDAGGFQGEAALPLAVYASNIILNWTWTPIFFIAKKPKIAFFEINLVTATAAATGYLFYKVNPVAGYLFAPYLLWLGVATALNYRIWKDNDDDSCKITEVKDK